MHSNTAKFLFVLIFVYLISPGFSKAADLTLVEKSFVSFCKGRLQLKNEFAARQMQCRKANGGGYVAEYEGFSDSFSTRIKVADPAKDVYVGILAYSELKLQHHGSTMADAKRGPFSEISHSPIKEIFLYRNGKWLD